MTEPCLREKHTGKIARERNRDVAAGMSVVEVASKTYFRKVGHK